MTDLHPALDGECCVRCHAPIDQWYVAVPLTPMIDEVVCIPCVLTAEAAKLGLYEDTAEPKDTR